jgi:hypothetical protein
MKVNAVQKAYMKARAVREAAEDRMNRLEAGFLASRGRAEKHIWMIDDESVFDLLNAEFSESPKHEYEALIKAREDLKQAENALIAYGLSIMPEKYKKEAGILRSSRDITVRRKLIDLAFRLDTGTVPRKYTA